MTSWHRWDALELAGAVRRGDVTASELTEHHLERIERLDASLGAFVTVTADLARTQAARADAAVAAGRMPDGAPLPPLLGVPTAIKDLNVVDGVPTGFGTALRLPGPEHGVPAPPQDHVVTLLLRAGVVVLGKTATPEFGLPCYTESDVARATRTPWAPGNGGEDPGRTAGGSSGGAAAAVAARLVPMAQGSDGGGSIRIPASCCGVYGLKPTRGRISNGPLLGDLTGLAWNGPLARSVADAAAMLDAMAVPMPGDPGPQPVPSRPFLTSVGADCGRLRIGRFVEPVIAEADVHPECVVALEATSALLEDQGHEVVDVRLPIDPRHVANFEAVWSASAAALPVPPGQESLLRPLTRWLRERGARVEAARYLRALAGMQALTRDVAQFMVERGCDLLLSPTLAELPAPVGHFTRSGDPAEDFTLQERFTPYTSLYNVTGQPAASLPVHWTLEGLPVGVMLAAPFGREDLLIALSAQVERAVRWGDQVPPGYE